MIYRLLASILLLFAASATLADCEPLTGLPAVIDAPGHYCLDAPATAAIVFDEAILIEAGNVTLDLNGHSLTNVGTEDGACHEDLLNAKTVGIRIASVTNVTVRNGSVACFGRGIEGQSSCDGCAVGHTIENMNVHDSGEKGIILNAWNATVRGNHVFRTGLAEDVVFAAGIEVLGSGNAIVDNDVMSVSGTNASGITTAVGEANLVAGNRVQQSEYGFLMFGGSAVRFRDNLTADVRRAYAGPGIDLGNND